MDMKKLFRSNKNKMICGVCGGVAEYLNIDPTIIRLLWVILGFTGIGLIAYIVAAVIMPVQQELIVIVILDIMLIKTEVIFSLSDNYVGFYGIHIVVMFFCFYIKYMGYIIMN